MTALPTPEAAAALGVTPGTLRRWIDAGAPVARHGTRGRGRCTLIDPDVVRAWQRQQGGDDLVLVLAAELPVAMAARIYAAHRELDTPDKRRLAEVFAVAWQTCTDAVIDALRTRNAAVPDPVDPLLIEALRKIARS